MDNVKDVQGEYVHKVRENTRQFAQDLMAENEKLRDLVGSLETERTRLHEQVFALREQLDNQLQERGLLQQQVAEVEARHQRFTNRYVEIEQQNADLANLYVASYRLHATMDRQEVLAVIQEIIINLIGSEELGIFELSPDGSTLQLLASFGIDPARYLTLPVASSFIGRTAIAGETYLAAERNGNAVSSDETNLTACIPLKLEGRVTGAIAVFRLLDQKAGLEALDRELFDLLATHAATALYCTGLYANAVYGSAQR